MSNQSIGLNENLYHYLLQHSLREVDVLKRLREATSKLEMARMQIAPEQGQFMALLVQLIGARRALEVGVFTGYSTACVAQALPADGEVIACDVSEEWTSMARPYWRELGVEHKIDLRLAPALDTLNGLLDQGAAETFDFAFIDADKGNYRHYYEACLDLLVPGGLMVIDNVLWNGSVADPSDTSEDTEAIRALNQALVEDHRVDISMIPVADGLTLARKAGTLR